MVPVQPQTHVHAEPVAQAAPVGQAMSSGSATAEMRATGRMDATEIARISRIYYIELLAFFRSQVGQSTQLSGSRSNAREKLTRLSKLQFAELSTDVHDELKRRQLNAEGSRTTPYLQGRNDFHPKRNQARQKLATLPKNRFRDLASDVFFELERRFPEFPAELRPEPLDSIMAPQEQNDQHSVRSATQHTSMQDQAHLQGMPGQNPQANYAPVQAQDGAQYSADNTVIAQQARGEQPLAPPTTQTLAQSAAQPVPEPAPQSLYGQSSGVPVDEHMADFDQVNSKAGPQAVPEQNMRAVPDGADRLYDTSQTETLAAGAMWDTPKKDSVVDQGSLAQPQMSTPKVFIPTKDTSVEETVSRDPTAQTEDTRAAGVLAANAPDAELPREMNGTSDVNAARDVNLAGSATHTGDMIPASDMNRMQDAYEGRVAALLDHIDKLEQDSRRNAENSVNAAVNGLHTQNEQLAARIAELEREVTTHQRMVQDLHTQGNERSLLFDSKHRELEQSRNNIASLQSELSNANSSRAIGSQGPGASDELRNENEFLRGEIDQQQQVVLELRNEVASLVDELRTVSARNDAMMTDKESDVTIIRDLNQQMATFKRRFEQTRAELRALKTTSQLCAQPLRLEEGMYVSERGAIADSNFAQFQSSIDELLVSSRAHQSSSVLVGMKSVVLATTLITDDITKYESSPDNDLNALSEQQMEDLQSLKVSTSEALTNLMGACRNHASSQGLAPVSLVDAAASHVAMAIVETIKLLKLRKTEDSYESLEFDNPADSYMSDQQTGLKPLHMSSRSASVSGPSSTSRRRPPPPLSVNQSRSLADNHSPTQPDTAQNEPDLSNVQRQRNPSISRYSPVGYVNGRNVPSEWEHGQNESFERRPSATTLHQSPLEAETGTIPAPRVPDTALMHSTSRSTSGATSSLPTGAADIGTSRAFSTSSAGAPTETGAPSTAPTTDADGFAETHENWAELRNYIEVQTEAIVHSIQSLLSALREGAQGVQLNENLTQITTIVSSIVAISQDHLSRSTSPRHGVIAQQAERIFADLSENCDRLIDMQSNASYDRTTKSIMASASYGVAKGLKALNELLNDVDEADAN